MKLEQSFEVDAPLERVWEALVDVERVAPALPGAAVTGRNDDGSYGGTFTVKIGPTTASYAGKLLMEEVDESAHRAVMQANGSDKRGQGGAKATIVSTLSEVEGGGTRVEVSTDYHITGRLARFGRGGMIEDISAKLLREFAKRLQDELAGGGDAAATAADGGAAPAADGGAATAADGGAATVADGGAAASASDAPDQPAPLASADAETASAAEASADGASDAAAESPATKASESPAAAVSESPAAGGSESPSAEVSEAPAEPVKGEAPAEGEMPGEPEAPPVPPKPEAPPAPRPPMAAAEPLDAGSLVGSVLLDRVKRNPLPLAFLAGLLVAFVMLRRRRSD